MIVLNRNLYQKNNFPLKIKIKPIHIEPMTNIIITILF